MTTVIQTDSPSPHSFAFGLVASGNSQSNATPVPARRNVFTSVPSGMSAIMSAPGKPTEIVISNYGANTLTLFPPGGWSFNNGTVTASVTIAANTSLILIAGDPANATWWTRT